jgi:small conductance mechanosensitive channel
MSHGIHVLIIAGAAYLTIRVANLGIQYLQLRTAGGAEAIADSERRRREATLTGILASLVTVAVLFGAGLMILHELSINVVPILTGAGIAGLAIGFGAQYVVRDVIAGFFLILEDQIRVGDLTRIQGVTGLVEQINLRTIVLRDADGAVHVFPNGGVTTLANLSKEYAYAVVDVIVPLGEDVERAIATLEDVGALAQKDAALAAFVLAPLEVLGVESLGDVNLTIRARFKTPPLAQATIARELRRRIANEFAARGIRPYARAAGNPPGQ